MTNLWFESKTELFLLEYILPAKGKITPTYSADEY